MSAAASASCSVQPWSMVFARRPRIRSMTRVRSSLSCLGLTAVTTRRISRKTSAASRGYPFRPTSRSIACDSASSGLRSMPEPARLRRCKVSIWTSAKRRKTAADAGVSTRPASVTLNSDSRIVSRDARHRTASSTSGVAFGLSPAAATRAAKRSSGVSSAGPVPISGGAFRPGMIGPPCRTTCR